MRVRPPSPSRAGLSRGQRAQQSEEKLGALLARCEALLHELSLPSPFDVETLSHAIAEQRGRPIVLHPVHYLPGLAGLWIAAQSADLIVYARRTTHLHQQHIILHELCHLCWRHPPVAVALDEHADLLLPDLRPDTLRRVPRRFGYTAVEEREAEALASLILERAALTEHAQATPVSGPEGAVLERLADLLEGERAPPC